MPMQVFLVEQVTWNELHEIYLTKKLWLPMCQPGCQLFYYLEEHGFWPVEFELPKSLP
jgi:hypothetical protein